MENSQVLLVVGVNVLHVVLDEMRVQEEQVRLFFILCVAEEVKSFVGLSAHEANEGRELHASDERPVEARVHLGKPQSDVDDDEDFVEPFSLLVGLVVETR